MPQQPHCYHPGNGGTPHPQRTMSNLAGLIVGMAFSDPSRLPTAAGEPAPCDPAWSLPEYPAWKRALALSPVTLCMAVAALGAYGARMANLLG
jgi:hypothetical protein